MLLYRTLLSLFVLFPVMVCAHNLIEGQPVTPVTISEQGELLLSNDDDISYQPWSTAQLEGRVRIVQYIAGRKTAKKKNSLLIKAIKQANFSGARFQPVTIVNADDEIFGSGLFVKRKLEKNKRNYPWAQFIIDNNGLGRRAWKLNENSSTIIVLDKGGRVQWAKDGGLTPDEVFQVITLLHHLIELQ